jgi:hypothetical protein
VYGDVMSFSDRLSKGDEKVDGSPGEGMSRVEALELHAYQRKAL